jgi:hypothetical protein
MGEVVSILLPLYVNFETAADFPARPIYLGLII